VAAVLWVKAQRSHFLQMLASPPGSPENRRCRRHFRKAFGRHAPGKDLKTAPRNIICGVLTALTTTRALEYPVSLSTGPITSPFTGVTGFRPSSKVVRDFWKEFGVGKPSHSKDLDRASWKKFHISTKSGPNGPALWSALADLGCLPGTLRASIRQVGGEELHRKMELNLRHYHRFVDYFPCQGRLFRRLVAIPDMEKSRTIAIMDYWSQTALKPLHQYLFGILRRIPQDVTFDQSRFLEIVRGWGEVKYHSIDLTNATDRFPVSYIGDVLGGAFTKEYVSAWTDIMVGYPFVVSTKRVGTGSEAIISASRRKDDITKLEMGEFLSHLAIEQS